MINENNEIKTLKSSVPLSGTFISLWLVENWTDEMWDAELYAYKQAGFEYIIISPAVVIDKEKKITTYYDTNIDEYKIGFKGTDVFENVFRNCKRNKIKVFVGTLQDDAWWDLWWKHSKTLEKKEWIFDCMNMSNKLAKDVYEKYSQKYSDVIYGWYIIWEIWNFEVMKLNARGRNQMINLLSLGINLHLDYLTELSPSMPVLISPFANMKISSIEDLKWQWADLINNINFRSGDILCPQDSIGAGGTKIEELEEVMKAYTFAKSFKPEMKLWANNEDFEQYDWKTTTLDRFVRQLEITSKYAEKNITFAYNNYYSPLNVNNGFHEAFLYYKNNGKLKTDTPSKVQNIKIERTENRIKLTWDIPEVERDKLAGFIIFANGHKIGTARCSFKNGEKMIPELENFYIDTRKSDEIKNTVEYTIISHDFFGNYSLESCIRVDV